MTSGQALWTRAKQIIPGGNQLLSKHPDRFLPEGWPTYYQEAKGCMVRDLDGKEYRDFSHMGVGCCTLGYADPRVMEAVHTAAAKGVMCTLNPPEEVALAERLLDLHPWAAMVRFGRCGGEACAMAVRIARAATGRDLVAFCGYHGWHDWYLAANLAQSDNLEGHLLSGLPAVGLHSGLTGSALPFSYNRIDELKKIVSEHGDRLAAIIMEPERSSSPLPDFLTEVRSLADQCGAVFIIDEITAGFRCTLGGHHLILGVRPDMAVLGKALGNGHPMAAVLGIREIMEAATKTFISSTMWTERIGPVAALATLNRMEEIKTQEHLIQTGRRIMDGWHQAADAAGLPIKVSGIPPLAHFSFSQEHPEVLTTLFTQEMLDKGYLAGAAVYASQAHEPRLVEEYLEAVAETFRTIAKALDNGTQRSALRGPVMQTGFGRLA